MSQLRIQDARAVAYRALCIGAILKRLELEKAMKAVDEWAVFDEVRQHFINKQNHHHHQLEHWLLNEGLSAHLCETERFVLSRPLGSWSERTTLAVRWRTEALGMMLWALNRLDDIPAYDTPFDLDTMLVVLDIYHPTIDFIWLATLRPDFELARRRDQAEVWHWRSRARELKQMGVRPPEGVSFDEIIQLTAEQAYRNGHIERPINGDFPAMNTAYADLDTDEYAILSALTYERNSAISWICEISNEWENIRID
ncbi:MAG: DUF4272 domain-containing protein [Anaerolineae bacterium]